MSTSRYNYTRRRTHEVTVGNSRIGGENPVRLQSMTNTSTNDVDGSVTQIIDIARAGADIVRLTAQGLREVESLRLIESRLRETGFEVPLVADIHFNTKAAFAAAEVVEKVRINPGNFADPGRTFKKIEYTDEEYAEKKQQLRDLLVPFYELCRANGVAVRIGVNHGSLSDRIMSRYGDTPAGMVESAMEFLRIARDIAFNQIVLSIKSSNTRVMVQTVRLLVEAMEREDMTFPLHLGVTEAGAGEDGRIKSAIGIGTLLAEGIGDTIRVSLSEHPANEIPVARELVEYITSRKSVPAIKTDISLPKGCINRFSTEPIGFMGAGQPPVVIVDGGEEADCADEKPDYHNTDSFVKIHLEDESSISRALDDARKNPDKPLLLSTTHLNPTGMLRYGIDVLRANGIKNSLAVKLSYGKDLSKDQIAIRSAADFGALLIDNLIDGVMLEASNLTPSENAHLLFGILQGAGSRITRTEFIACPGCGRTLFDLEDTLAKVKRATDHLKGLKIGVMGCIVNGPGEMADADYGYVGAAKGHVSLYRGKSCVEKNIPASEAVDKLIALIKADGKWIEP